MGKCLPKKGKFGKNNDCRKARGIFAHLSRLRQMFPNVNHKLKKNCIILALLILSTNAVEQKKSSSRFLLWGNIFPPLKLRHSLPVTYLKIDT